MTCARQFLPLLLLGGRGRRRNRTGSLGATTGYDPYACAATCSSQMGACPELAGPSFLDVHGTSYLSDNFASGGTFAAMLELPAPAAPKPPSLSPAPLPALVPQASGYQGVRALRHTYAQPGTRPVFRTFPQIRAQFESMLPFLYMSNSRRASSARLPGVVDGPPLLMGCIATCASRRPPAPVTPHMLFSAATAVQVPAQRRMWPDAQRRGRGAR